MEFLDKLVLPHSGSNLELLKYLLAIATVIFEIFAGALFGSAILSVFFRQKAKKTSSALYGRLSIDFIDLIIQNRTMGIGLGVVPFFSIILIYIQLLHGTNSALTGFLILSFVLFAVALVLLNFYRHTSHLNNVFEFFKNKLDTNEHNYQTGNFTELDRESFEINNKSAVWGIALMFLSMWLFIGTLSVTVDSSKWSAAGLIGDVMFSFGSIVNFLHFITSAFALSGIAFVVKYFFWDKPDLLDEEYDSYTKRLNTAIALIGSSVQPVFFVLNILVTPHKAFLALPFGLMFAAALLVFVLVRMLYQNLKTENYRTSTLSFYVFLLIFGLIIFKEQSSFGIAANSQIISLAAAYDKAEAEHAENASQSVVVNAKEIYEAKCGACHKFDSRLVGPPHKEVLLKYKDKKDAMVQFILNPVKVDPAYPAMPNQGLTPKEAKAIVEYLFKEYGNKLE